MGLQFDRRISVGHVLSVIVIAIPALIAFANLKADQESTARDVTRTEQRIDKMMDRSEATDSRIRMLEINDSNRVIELRGIYDALGRIEKAIGTKQ